MFRRRLQGLSTPGVFVRISMLTDGPVVDYLKYARYITVELDVCSQIEDYGKVNIVNP